MPPSSLSEPEQLPDPAILAELERAATCADVRLIMQNHSPEEVQAAWRHLQPVQRSALLLMRFSQGEIHHELTAADWGQQRPADSL